MVFRYLAVAVIAMLACNSAPKSEPKPPAPETARGDVDEDRKRDRPSERDNESRESPTPPGGHWWGQIQQRADRAHAELEEEITACLKRLGDARRVREIALHARRHGSAGSPYEIVDMVTHPPDAADDKACVRALGDAYVDAVGSAFWDDFDTYIATFVHRGDPSGACRDDAVEHAVCHPAPGGDRPSSRDVDAESGGCDDGLVDAVHRALSDQRHCWSAPRFSDRLRSLEDEPIHLRAVLFGHIRIDDGQPRLTLRYNQPWVGSMADCVIDQFDDGQFSAHVDRQPCVSQLPNRAITYWHRPTFTYMHGD